MLRCNAPPEAVRMSPLSPPRNMSLPAKAAVVVPPPTVAKASANHDASSAEVCQPHPTARIQGLSCLYVGGERRQLNPLRLPFCTVCRDLVAYCLVTLSLFRRPKKTTSPGVRNPDLQISGVTVCRLDHPTRLHGVLKIAVVWIPTAIIGPYVRRSTLAVLLHILCILLVVARRGKP